MIGRFSGPLRIEKAGQYWSVLEPFVYTASDGPAYRVPALFVTDLASIPRGLWNLLPPTGEYDQAAVLHDYLYAVDGVTRARADWLFRDAAHALGVGWWTRQALYLGVRVGGWAAWRRYRQEDQEPA